MSIHIGLGIVRNARVLRPPPQRGPHHIHSAGCMHAQLPCIGYADSLCNPLDRYRIGDTIQLPERWHSAVAATAWLPSFPPRQQKQPPSLNHHNISSNGRLEMLWPVAVPPGGFRAASVALPRPSTPSRRPHVSKRSFDEMCGACGCARLPERGPGGRRLASTAPLKPSACLRPAQRVRLSSALPFSIRHRESALLDVSLRRFKRPVALGVGQPRVAWVPLIIPAPRERMADAPRPDQ